MLNAVYINYDQSVNIQIQKKGNLMTFKSKALISLAAIALTMSACAQNSTSPAAAQSTAATSVSSATALKSLSSGAFSGRSDHVTSGTATIVKTDAGYQLVLSADFVLDGAPDPVVALGNGETYNVSNKLGALKNRTGGQRYDIPANLTPSNFTEVYIWCEQFSVPLGVAVLAAEAGEGKYGS